MKGFLRSLARARGLFSLLVFTLAFSIGAAILVVALTDYVFRQCWSFTDINRVVYVAGRTNEQKTRLLGVSTSRYELYKDSQTVFSGIAGDRFESFEVTDGDETSQMFGLRTTANYFDVLGVQPLLGRAVRAEEEDSADVVLIAESLWRRKFGSDPQILGRVLLMSGTPHTIIGVVPNISPYWSRGCELWTTRPFGPSHAGRAQKYLRVVGRLRTGVRPEQAQAALLVLHEDYQKRRLDAVDRDWIPRVLPIPEVIVGHLRPIFRILLVSVAFVLILACCNIANLFGVRHAGRHREIAVRLALGASRGDVVKMLLFESLLVSAFSCGIGLLIANWLLRIIPVLVPDVFPEGVTIPLNGSVLVFTLGLLLAVGFSTGAHPAWCSTRESTLQSLKEGGHSLAGGNRQRALGNGLVAIQVALSLVLFVCASLFLTSFQRLIQQDLGFSTRNVWVGSVSLPSTRYPNEASRLSFRDRLLEELRSVPNLESVALASDVPLTGGTTLSYAVADGDIAPVEQRPSGFAHRVSTGYFATLGIPLLAGREFSNPDSTSADSVVVISRSTANRLFKGRDAIGRTILLGADSAPAEIVGVVGDARTNDISRENDAEFYRPLEQGSDSLFMIVVRAAMQQPGIPAIRTALRHVDPDLPLIRPTTLDYYVRGSVGQRRVIANLIGGFAILALPIALVGIYAVVAFTVRQRRREIGVRMALGARWGDIVCLISCQGLKPVIVGLLIGLTGTLALGGIISSQLYGIAQNDPRVLASAVIAFGIMATVACGLPAAAAARVNPIDTLKLD